MKLLTTREAGERLGVTMTRVQQFISTGRLPAHRFGRVFLIDEKNLKLVQNRKPGRPRSAARKKRNVDAAS